MSLRMSCAPMSGGCVLVTICELKDKARHSLGGRSFRARVPAGDRINLYGSNTEVPKKEQLTALWTECPNKSWKKSQRPITVVRSYFLRRPGVKEEGLPGEALAQAEGCSCCQNCAPKSGREWRKKYPQLSCLLPDFLQGILGVEVHIDHTRSTCEYRVAQEKGKEKV